MVARGRAGRKWSREPGSNRWPQDYKSSALPAELSRPLFLSYLKRPFFSKPIKSTERAITALKSDPKKSVTLPETLHYLSYLSIEPIRSASHRERSDEWNV